MKYINIKLVFVVRIAAGVKVRADDTRMKRMKAYENEHDVFSSNIYLASVKYPRGSESFDFNFHFKSKMFELLLNPLPRSTRFSTRSILSYTPRIVRGYLLSGRLIVNINRGRG